MDNIKVVESGEEKTGVVIKKIKRYDVGEIMNDLRRLRVRVNQLLITIPANTQIGIKTLGKIDYLIRQGGYVVKRQEHKERKEGEPKKKETRERRLFFDDKNCHICRNPAKIFRLMKDRIFYICEKKHCDYQTEILSGFFREIPKTERG